MIARLQVCLEILQRYGALALDEVYEIASIKKNSHGG